MIRASEQDGSYPRPQLVRETWTSLDGQWQFSHDDENLGLGERWFAVGQTLPRTITVPFAPESRASGIGETGFHPTVWYRRELPPGIPAPGMRRILHFGAVDHECRVWVDGVEVDRHVGGQTPFQIDITDAVALSGPHEVVVRAFDDPLDMEIPRGKQDWQLEPHAIWYTRTTGIWQTVWMEDVPEVHIAALSWVTDLVEGTITAEIAVPGGDGLDLQVVVEDRGDPLGVASARVERGRAAIVVNPTVLRSGQSRDELLWSPENPVLLDASVTLSRDGQLLDEVSSYLGMRSAGVAGGTFQLNGVPYFVRAVLEQGFWPQSLLTAPDDAARRREVELIRELGFNTARIHQKVEDPRFLFWADRVGLLIWGETASAYDFTPRAVELLTQEWPAIVRRDRSHPCIVVWVPVNESWGAQDVSLSLPQREYVRALAALTRALDPTRPVVSNDGWEHIDSDLLTVHDYTFDPPILAARYADDEAVRRLPDRMGPSYRPLSLSDELSHAVRSGRVPVIVSEFGGISFAEAGTWGYASVDSAQAYEDLVRALFQAVGERSALAGYCYTQLTDTMQEANGLLTADREPKLPIEVIRGIVRSGATRIVWPPV
jgi:beta-galactosidase/beta-glucuronidase